MPEVRKSSILDLLAKATLEQSRDTGLAGVLICLLTVYFWGYHQFLPVAILLLLTTLIWPGLFRPFAGMWFGLSHLLGTVVSKVILTALFFLIVTPIAWIRRFLGADPLQLQKWKNGKESVFVKRSGLITPPDLEKPY